MKSFQKRGRGYRTLQTKKCTHGRSQLIHLKNVQIYRCQTPKPNSAKGEYKGRQIGNRCQNVGDDPHAFMMRSLIAMNQDYFQSKLEISNDGKPKQLKLKIPSKTGFTIYKRDYIKNSQSQTLAIPKFNQSKIDGAFFGNTTYRNEYLGQQNSGKAQKVNRHQSVDPEAPRFLQTQYKHNFQNWGADNFMPSMKPDHVDASTNLPFQAVSMYSSDFTNKPRSKFGQNQNNSAVTAFNASNSSIIASQVTSPLLYMTTSNVFFDKKKNSKENNLKPKNHSLRMGAFKGKTQYQSEFIKSGCVGTFSPSKKKPLNELQNLILNL